MAQNDTQLDQDSNEQSTHSASFLALTIGSAGIVYGDIGTSPLYTFREAVMSAQHSGLSAEASVIGLLSLILWALILIVTGKYVLLLLRADNKGEGGTFALMSLAQRNARSSSKLILGLAIIGASFFYGDSIITPAISVLSAVEGLQLLAPDLKPLVLPASIVILGGLFALQPFGTTKVATLFGPVMLIWFAVLGIGGLIHIADDPTIIRAINPWYGVNFVATNGLSGLWSLGFVFLAVTGAEALYADLGHFGRRPIQTAWLGLVLPCLVLNYVGQGALVLTTPEAIKDPFYLLYPGWALIPVLGLATLATIIASQAVITGTFSLTRQAIQLNLLPRFRIAHTSESMPGQIYIPRVNIILAVAVIFVVLMFESSSNLAAAYGVAVTADMMISSFLLFFVLWRLWGWPVWRAALIIVPLVLIEQVFFGANVAKLFDGAWLPILIAAIIAFLMMTWRRGANLLAAVTRRSETDFLWLAQNLDDNPPHRVPGTAILFTADPETAPMALMHNLKHNHVLHERNIVLTIVTEEEPRVPRYERVQIEPINDVFTRVIASYGFMETPNVPKILEHCRQKGLEIDIDETSFFLSRRMLTPSGRSDMPRWQKRIFGWLTRTAENAMTYYHIPPDRVIEIGTQVTL